MFCNMKEEEEEEEEEEVPPPTLRIARSIQHHQGDGPTSLLGQVSMGKERVRAGEGGTGVFGQLI